MPELPEVEAVRLTLSPILAGKQIKSFEALWERTIAAPAPQIFGEQIANQQILGLQRRGKYLVIPLSSGDFITVHLRMTGELRYFPTLSQLQNASESKYLRALIGFSDESALAFFDIRKFGRIELLNPEQLDEFQHKLGVEPLDPCFTELVWYRLLQRYRRQIKALLLDQKIIAGLGNIYVDEALFLSQIHPRALSNSLSEDQAQKLHANIVAILQLAIENRGTTFRNYRSGLGDAGTNQSSLQIYGRKAESPCMRCGTPLQRTVIAQRGTVFCPACQPVPASS